MDIAGADPAWYTAARTERSEERHILTSQFIAPTLYHVVHHGVAPATSLPYIVATGQFDAAIALRSSRVVLRPTHILAPASLVIYV
jgi:hypothetical protein